MKPVVLLIVTALVAWSAGSASAGEQAGTYDGVWSGDLRVVSGSAAACTCATGIMRFTIKGGTGTNGRATCAGHQLALSGIRFTEDGLFSGKAITLIGTISFRGAAAADVLTGEFDGDPTQCRGTFSVRRR